MRKIFLVVILVVLSVSVAFAQTIYTKSPAAFYNDVDAFLNAVVQISAFDKGGGDVAMSVLARDISRGVAMIKPKGTECVVISSKEGALLVAVKGHDGYFLTVENFFK